MMYKWRVSLFTLLLVGALGLIFFTTGSAFAACPEGMISYWKLDEGTLLPGGTYEDSFNANDGTGSANPTAAAGIVGGAQAFNGNNTGIEVPAHPSFGWYQNQSFSIEFWVKRDDTVLPADNEVVIGRYESATSLRWWVGITPAQTVSFSLTATNNTGYNVVGTTDVVDGTWHHVVAIRGSGELLLYVDGVLDNTTPGATYGAGFESTSADLTIGVYNATFHLDGLADEVALYDRALLLTEIEDHYDAGLLGHGIDYVAPGDGDGDGDDNGGGGGGGGGCFITTVAK